MTEYEYMISRSFDIGVSEAIEIPNGELLVRCPGCNDLLCFERSLKTCWKCGRPLTDNAGIFNFITSTERCGEMTFYNNSYGGEESVGLRCKKGVGLFDEIWQASSNPENQIVLRRLGKLEEKNVLLLGNGESEKELRFLLSSPGRLVYSDLSKSALLNIMGRFDLSGYEEILHFATIDALDIPFDDNSFDVVYGYAMVHHLPDLSQFFSSVMRVLKPGGYTVFMDDGYTPLWHWGKQSILRPLMQFSQRKTGISPEDHRFSMSGGFRESELASCVYEVGGLPWFQRVSFVTYLYCRAVEKLLSEPFKHYFQKPTLGKIIRTIDKLVCSIPAFKRDQVRLIWGFQKPACLESKV